MGSVPLGHPAIAAALVLGGLSLPAAAILENLPAASFVTRPPGTAWQGAWLRERVSPLPSGSSAGAQAAGVGELSGSGMAGSPRCRDPCPGESQAWRRASDRRALGCPCSRHASARPCPRPPPGSLRASHPSRPRRHPRLTAPPEPPPAPLAVPAWRRLCRHRKRFSRHGGPARRRPERALGARPRAQP